MLPAACSFSSYEHAKEKFPCTCEYVCLCNFLTSKRNGNRHSQKNELAPYYKYIYINIFFMDSNTCIHIAFLLCIFHCLNEFFIRIWLAGITWTVYVLGIVALNKIYRRVQNGGVFSLSMYSNIYIGWDFKSRGRNCNPVWCVRARAHGWCVCWTVKNRCMGKSFALFSIRIFDLPRYITSVVLHCTHTYTVKSQK